MRYLLSKLLLAVPTLLVVAIAIFALMRMIPGDPAILIVGETDDPALLASARHELGLDQSIVVQFGLWAAKVFRGDLGVSLISGEPVLSAMTSRFGVTLQVVILAIALSALIAVPLGTYAAWRQNKAGDRAVVLTVNFLVSIPSFWIGLMLILLFGATLKWLPTVGYISVTEDVGAGIRYLILPTLALLFVEVATITRMVRASTLEVLRQDYVMSARAKGLSESDVLRRHVVRNAFAPTMTLIGLMLGSLLGGVAVIETVFTLPGLGRLLVDAIYARDYAVVQGVLLLVAFVHVIINLIVDMLYLALDPRVQL